MFRDALVALHSDFDRLIMGRDQLWKTGWVDGESDGARDAGLSGYEAGFFERSHHLMDRRRGDLEEALHIGLCGRPAEQALIGVDEGEILALLGGEAGSRIQRRLNSSLPSALGGK